MNKHKNDDEILNGQNKKPKVISSRTITFSAINKENESNKKQKITPPPSTTTTTTTTTVIKKPPIEPNSINKETKAVLQQGDANVAKRIVSIELDSLNNQDNSIDKNKTSSIKSISKHEAIHKNIVKLIQENMKPNAQFCDALWLPALKMSDTNIQNKNIEIKTACVGSIDQLSTPPKSPLIQLKKNKKNFEDKNNDEIKLIDNQVQVNTEELEKNGKKKNKDTKREKSEKNTEKKTKPSKKFVDEKEIPKNLHLKNIISSASGDISQLILPILHLSGTNKNDNINNNNDKNNDDLRNKYKNLLETFKEITLKCRLNKPSVDDEKIPKVPPRNNSNKKSNNKNSKKPKLENEVDSSITESKETLTNVTTTQNQQQTLTKLAIEKTTYDNKINNTNSITEKSSSSNKNSANLNDSELTIKSQTSSSNLQNQNQNQNLETLKKEIDKTMNDLSTFKNEVTIRIQQNNNLNRSDHLKVDKKNIDSACNTDISMSNPLFSFKYDITNDSKIQSYTNPVLNESTSSNTPTSAILEKIMFINNNNILNDTVINNPVAITAINRSNVTSDNENDESIDSSVIESHRFARQRMITIPVVKDTTKDDSIDDSESMKLQEKEIQQAKENLRLKLENELNKRILEKVANSAMKQLDDELKQIESYNIIGVSNKQNDIKITTNNKNTVKINTTHGAAQDNVDHTILNKKNNNNESQIVLCLLPLKRNNILRPPPSSQQQLKRSNANIQNRKTLYQDNFEPKLSILKEYEDSSCINTASKKTNLCLNNQKMSIPAPPIRVLKDARNKKNYISTEHKPHIITPNQQFTTEYTTSMRRNNDFRRPHSYIQIESNDNSIHNNKHHDEIEPKIRILNRVPSHHNDNIEIEVKLEKSIPRHLQSTVLTNRQAHDKNSYELPINYVTDKKPYLNSKFTLMKKSGPQYKIRYPSTSSGPNDIEEKLRELINSDNLNKFHNDLRYTKRNTNDYYTSRLKYRRFNSDEFDDDDIEDTDDMETSDGVDDNVYDKDYLIIQEKNDTFSQSIDNYRKNFK